MTIPATGWRDNATLIAEGVRPLYLRDDDRVLDVTYGRGAFWKRWRPEKLTTHDIALDGVDFRNLPHPDRSFDVVVIDPPYKLNGRPDLGDMDDRYGVHVPRTWQERHDLILDGITDCARVADRLLLVKCQDQVARNYVRWQTRIFGDHAEGLGFFLRDQFDLAWRGRRQPAGRPQRHAQQRGSTLLVLERGVRR